MKIVGIEVAPLRVPYKQPFHWAHGVVHAAEVVLVSVITDEGVTGYGESMGSASADAIALLLREAGKVCVGRCPLQISELMRGAYKSLFASQGNCSNPRFGALVLAGLDMALWDVAGKTAGRSVHELLGGAVRDHVSYFGFPQGDTAEMLAQDAKMWSDKGCKVIYIKVGRGESLDLEVVQKVRSVIGNKRLRVDANEAWDILTTRRMTTALSSFSIEFIEQPTGSDSLSALRQIRAVSPIPIAADQSVFTPEDVYAICQQGAADLIVLGLHEAGGILRFQKAAAIAEASGINICLHGLYETGITTCASNQVGATLVNLDDGNQYMNHFLVEDVIERPILSLHDGTLPVIKGPGLGFDLDWDAVARAKEAYRKCPRA